MTAQEIEIAVAAYFNYRANLIVPNVYWGLGLFYEADLVVLRKSDWAIEVEIKVTRQDIKADLKKRWRHDSDLFRQLYFAVPEALKDDPNIPEHAGVLSVSQTNLPGVLKVKKTRDARIRKSAVKWDAARRRKLHELAAMRIWSLKKHLARFRAG